MSDDDKNNLQEQTPDPDLKGDGTIPENKNQHVRQRVRVKVRKKIRIKQKPSTKKMVRKLVERAFWVIIVVGFVAALIIMIVELDVRDDKFKQQRSKGTPVKGQ